YQTSSPGSNITIGPL
nr:RecName: Full=Pregnancy-associated glycoprotein 56B; Short=FdPAG56B [Dama dama]